MGRDEQWFRRFFETAADQGAAAVEEGVDDRYQWPDDVDPEIAGRYKTPAELARAKREGDAAVTRATQEAASARQELEAFRAEQETAQQQWQDPLQSQLPQIVAPEMAQRLEVMFSRDPAGAYDLAAEAAPGYGTVLQSRIFNAWFQEDPVAALQHVMTPQWSNAMDERFQSYEDALIERLGPTLAHATTQVSESAVAQARTLAPDFGAYEERINQMLDAEQGGNPALIADVMGNVTATAERLVFLRDSLWAADERQKQVAAGQAATATVADAPKARPRQATIASGSAPRPGNDEDYAAQRKSEMKGVKPRALG